MSQSRSLICDISLAMDGCDISVGLEAERQDGAHSDEECAGCHGDGTALHSCHEAVAGICFAALDAQLCIVGVRALGFTHEGSAAHTTIES